MNCKDIGDFIAKSRKAEGLTQAQLAEKVGVSDKAVSKWERGICMPEPASLKNVAEVLRVSVLELLNGYRFKDNKVNANEEAIIVSTTQESIKLYNNEIKMRSKKIALIIIIPLLLILSALASLFMFNNYGQCSMYDLLPKDNNIVADGHITITNEKRILLLTNILILDELNVMVKGFAFESELLLDDTLLYRNGNVGLYEYSKKDKLSELSNYVDSITIYLSENNGQYEYLDDLNSSSTFILNLKYMDEVLEEKTLTFEFELSQVFSNNKIFYKNAEF